MPPRYLWRLPWHYGRFSIECAQDAAGHYTSYRITTDSQWAPLELELIHKPRQAPSFDEQQRPYSVLIQPTTEFIIRLPPRAVAEA